MSKKPQIKPIPIRLPEDIRKWLEVNAEENVRSLSSEIIFRLKKAYKEEKERKGEQEENN